MVRLTSALLAINKNVSIEGNGITITRDSSWTATGYSSQLLYINDSNAAVTISRIHLKDGRATNYGGTIRNTGNLTMESCIISGNQTSEGLGDAINNGGTMNVKGCTFYGNSSADYGGAILNFMGTLTLEGNLFYGNTATSAGPVVYDTFGTVTSLGYNVVDVALGTGLAQSGFTAATGDKTVSSIPLSSVSFKLIGSGAAGVITSLPAGYPAVDFYGDPITAPAAVGAVQSAASGTAREVTIAMWDYGQSGTGDGWDGYAALRINVNGTNLEPNARLVQASGNSVGSYTFIVDKGDTVQIYWVSGGTYDYECAFAVYYSDAPPNPAFSPTTGEAVDNSGRLLVYLQYRPSGTPAVGNGTLMGSFTVP